MVLNVKVTVSLPSRDLLRDYEHSCGPSFAALVCREFPVGREPAGGLLHPLERGRAQQPVRGGGLRVLDQQGLARRRLLQKQTGRYLLADCRSMERGYCEAQVWLVEVRGVV